MFPEGRTTRELKALREDLSKLTEQVNALTSYIADLPHPPRAGWQRYSLPAFDTDPSIKTHIVPSVRPALHVLPRRIMRVTICASGNQQWVNAYDASGEKIPEYCGYFRNVGQKILAREPHLRWEQVGESA